MKKLILGLATILFTVSAGQALAAGVYGGYGSYGTQNCQPIYGGGETCTSSSEILLNKTVKNPKTGSFVDNLTINDPRYASGQTVTFQLTVTNTGNNVISEADVNDVFPGYLTNVTGPGSYNTNTKTLTFKIFNLNINESRTYSISGKVVSSDQLPSDQSVTCMANQASASVGNETSTDNSQFCVEKTATTATTKGGLPVYPAPSMNQTPATGPEMLPLLGMIPTALAGFALRRKSK